MTHGGRSPPVILGIGARSGLGHSAPTMSAAYRAGIARHRQHPSLLSHRHEPLMVVMDPSLPADLPIARRLIELVTHAAMEATAPLAGAVSSSIDVVVALPAPGPGVGQRVAEQVTVALRERLGSVRLGQVEPIAGGHRAGHMALERALALIASGTSAACLWCGVDSYLVPAKLDALGRQGLLHGPQSRWGFIPGEAAAACLIVPAELAGGAALASVAAVSTALERRPAGEVDTGAALTEATQFVLRALSASECVDRIYADLNGERGRVDAVGFTLSRISNRIATLPCMTTPADRLGDVGAAFAPVFAAMAVSGAQSGRASGPNVLLWTIEPSQAAGAALLHIPVRKPAR